MSALDELLEQTRDPDPEVRDRAAFDLYLRATNAERLLADYREHDARRRERAEVAVVELGRLILANSSSRRSLPFDQVRDIWRAACHG